MLWLTDGSKSLADDCGPLREGLELESEPEKCSINTLSTEPRDEA